MIKMAATPIYVINLKNLLQNIMTDCLETWCVASSIRILPRMFKLRHEIYRDHFYAYKKLLSSAKIDLMEIAENHVLY